MFLTCKFIVIIKLSALNFELGRFFAGFWWLNQEFLPAGPVRSNKTRPVPSMPLLTGESVR